MNTRTSTAAIGVALATAAIVAWPTLAQGSSADEGRVTGPQADKASSAALAMTDGGTANSVERDSENGATWEVEVTRPDGSTVDVRLDASYRLVVIEGNGGG